MTLNYQKVWETMNSLESVTSKICSAREILECAIEALESGKREKAETLMYAADEFLQYYLNDFDEKFKVAWEETVKKLKQEELSLGGWTKDISKCDTDNSSPECKQSWADFWEENYYPEEAKDDGMRPWGHSDLEYSIANKNKVKRWVLPVQEIENGDTMETEYFINLPDDLLEQAGWKENDELNWVDNQDGTFTLTKTTKPLGGDEC
jgi:hypothetical protein